jgi:hypothetical protein
MFGAQRRRHKAQDKAIFPVYIQAAILVAEAARRVQLAPRGHSELGDS